MPQGGFDSAVSIGGALYMVVFALIGLTTVNPLGPIILSSFALSFNVIPFTASIPLLINDPTMMGTAYGVWTSFVSHTAHDQVRAADARSPATMSS
jgi:hypothetical protein